jgi:hypothetical protein
MITAGIFVLLAGVLIIVQWVVSMGRKKVETSTNNPGGRGKAEMSFHLTAEFLTAGFLITAGFGLVNELAWSVNTYLIAFGMLIYTLINSSGYFAQLRQWPMVILFGLLVICSMISFGLLMADIGTVIY